jgi:uncharacterized protein
MGAGSFHPRRAGSLICEAVLTEACHLVAKEKVKASQVIEFIHRARLKPVSLNGELFVIEKLLERYADAPMDLADACVVRLAELEPKAVVCTTDRHFCFFRKFVDKPIPLMSPFAD